jgi:hypothetical protein
MITYAHLDGTRVLALAPSETPLGLPEVGSGMIYWPDPPYPKAVLHWVDGAFQWEDVRTLAESKTMKNEEINAARLAANRSGFVFSGKQIAADELSRSDIDAVAAIVARTGALPVDWPGAWKAVDNTFIPIADVATWDAFYAAMYATGLANFATAQGLKAQLASATTAEEVMAISWPT